MNNEELATRIKAGGAELIPQLWESVKPALYKRAELYYYAHIQYCKRRGVEVWDIKQVTYFAFLEAVKQYKPESEYKFITFVIFPFKSELAKLLNLRTEQARREPLNYSLSLEAPTATDTDGGELALLEILGDNSSLDFIEDMERAAVIDTVRGVVAALPAPLREIIEGYYFGGQTLGELGKQLHISAEMIRQYRNKAIRKLRDNKILRELYRDQKEHEYTEQGYSKHILRPENYGLKYYTGKTHTGKAAALAEFLKWEHITTSDTATPSERDKLPERA